MRPRGQGRIDEPFSSWRPRHVRSESCRRTGGRARSGDCAEAESGRALSPGDPSNSQAKPATFPMEVGRPIWHALGWESDGGQRPASFAYRRENRKKQKISSSVRRQHNTIPPATKPRPAGEARGTFYVATTFNQTIGAWNVASVKYMAPAVGQNRAHHFE